MNKYQEALDYLSKHCYEEDVSYDDDENEFPCYYRSGEKETKELQELIDKYSAMYEDTIEDAKFLKEVVEPNWEEIYRTKPIVVLQATKNGEFVGDTCIEPDYERALDKACELLSIYATNEEDGVEEQIHTSDEWKELFLGGKE